MLDGMRLAAINRPWATGFGALVVVGVIAVFLFTGGTGTQVPTAASSSNSAASAVGGGRGSSSGASNPADGSKSGKGSSYTYTSSPPNGGKRVTIRVSGSGVAPPPTQPSSKNGSLSKACISAKDTLVSFFNQPSSQTYSPTRTAEFQKLYSVMLSKCPTWESTSVLHSLHFP